MTRRSAVGLLDAIKSVLGLQRASAALAREQQRVLAGQMPILYLCLLLNSYFMGFAVMRSTSFLAAFGMPIVLTGVVALRLPGWVKSQRSTQPASLAAIRRQLAGSPIVTIMLSGMLCIWGITVLNTAAPIDKTYVALFVILNSITCAYCLMSMPLSAYLVIVIGAVPIAIALALTDERSLSLMGMNILLLSALVLRMIHSQFDQLRRIVTSRSEIMVEKSKVNRLAYNDHLTSLPNRRAFMSALSCLTLDEAGAGVAVVMIDLDGFKPINDTFGHPAGDAILIELGKRFRSVVGDAGLVARLGGDEFAVLLTDMADGDGAQDVATMLVDRAAEPCRFDGQNLQVSASLGLAYCPGLPTNAVDMLKHADIALYDAKSSNTMSVSLFETTMADRVRRRTMIEQALADPHLCDAIDLHFQPIFELHTMKIVSFEALARWTHHDLGDVSPAEFVPIAEQAGMIGRLTAHLFGKALETAKVWPADVTLSFNLSATELQTAELESILFTALEAHSFAPNRLAIEVTETALLDDFAAARRAIAGLRQHGIRVVLDDFGAGYASIGYLREIRFDHIKLDGSLVAPITYDAAARELLIGVLYLAQAIGAPVTAEMIETKDHLDLLRAMPIANVQGYFLSGPVRAAETFHLLEAVLPGAKIAGGL